MRRPMHGAMVLFLSCLAWGASANGRGEDAHDRAGEQLQEWLTGSFSSARQAAGDPEYRDIQLEMWPIWTERADGPWLYVEQAVAGQQNRPYRQRVYQLIGRGDGSFESRVYTLPDPARFVGAWRDEVGLSQLTPDSLSVREGCSIILRRADDGVFVGSTHARDCPSELRGASYATSEVRIDAHGMTSWDRGFDAEGRQVWGAVKGGYRFERVGH